MLGQKNTFDLSNDLKNTENRKFNFTIFFFLFSSKSLKHDTMYMYMYLRIESILGCFEDGSEGVLVFGGGCGPSLQQHPHTINPVRENCHMQSCVAFQILREGREGREEKRNRQSSFHDCKAALLLGHMVKERGGGNMKEGRER